MITFVLRSDKGNASHQQHSLDRVAIGANERKGLEPGRETAKEGPSGGR